jgi:hypothetical protein
MKSGAFFSPEMLHGWSSRIGVVRFGLVSGSQVLRFSGLSRVDQIKNKLQHF